jgi:hypothetical protein
MIEIRAKEPGGMYQTEAEVKVKDSSGKVVASQKYQKNVFDGLKADAKGNPEGGDDPDLLRAAIDFFTTEIAKKAIKGTTPVKLLLGHVTYSADLGQRQNIRQSLVTAMEGPDKAIEKSIKDYMAARAALGKPMTYDAVKAKLFGDD